MSVIDPSFLHNLVQLIHHTTTHGKPVAHTFILRSQASFALGWVVCLYEWGVSGDGVLQLKAWEGGWKGEKGLKQMEKLVPDMTGSSFARRIATHVTSGHLHVDGFKTGAEKSFKLSITHPDGKYSPFEIPLKALPSDVVHRQAFDFLKDSVSLNTTHRIGASPRELSLDPEPLLNAVPDAGSMVEVLKSKLDAEVAAHKRTKAELRDALEHEDRGTASQPAPVFQKRRGQNLASANAKANRTLEPTFEDEDGSSSNEDAPAPAKASTSGTTTSESEEDLSVDKASQPQSQSRPTSSLLPPSSSIANKSAKSRSSSQAKSKSSMGPPPPKASSKQPIASSSKSPDARVTSSPRRQPDRNGRSSSVDGGSDDMVATQIGSSQMTSPSQIKDTALARPPSIKKSAKIKAAKKRSKFGGSSSSDEEEPSQLAVKANAKPTKLPPLKKAKVADSDSSSGSTAQKPTATAGRARGKQKAVPAASAMDVDASGSETE